MNKEVMAKAIDEIQHSLPIALANPILNLHSKGGNWWENIDYSLRIKFTNWLRTNKMGEIGLGIKNLEAITASGKPVYVVMIELAFK